MLSTHLGQSCRQCRRRMPVPIWRRLAVEEHLFRLLGLYRDGGVVGEAASVAAGVAADKAF
jgi:hypothetical protein